MFHSLLSEVDDATPALDAVKVFDEIKEAKSKAFTLAVKLGLSPVTRRRICSETSTADDYLLKTLEEYGRLTEPRPSWEGVAKALNSTSVGLHDLAKRVREAHCPGIYICINHVY